MFFYVITNVINKAFQNKEIGNNCLFKFMYIAFSVYILHINLSDCIMCIEYTLFQNTFYIAGLQQHLPS